MLRVHRFAAAIDMIAAGTSAPMTIAAKATPANQAGNSFSNSCGTDCCGLVDLDAGRDRDEAEQGEQPEQEGVRRQQRRVATDHRAAAGGQHPGDRVRVHEQRQRRAERERGVGPVRRAGRDRALRRAAPAAIASAFALLLAANVSVTVLKMWPQPPTCEGR